MRAGRSGEGEGWGGEKGGKRGGEKGGKRGGEKGEKRGGEITPVYNVHPRGEGLAYFMGWFYLLEIFLVGEGGVWCGVVWFGGCDGCKELVLVGFGGGVVEW